MNKFINIGGKIVFTVAFNAWMAYVSHQEKKRQDEMISQKIEEEVRKQLEKEEEV